MMSPACFNCDDSFEGDDTGLNINITDTEPSLSSRFEVSEPSFIPSLISHWNPNITTTFQRPSSIHSMISHCAMHPPPGRPLVTMEDVFIALEKLNKQMKLFT